MSRRLSRPLVALATSLVLLAGCATNSGPSKYTQEVEDNYKKACSEANAPKLSAEAATEYCACTYGALVEKVPFKDFKKFDQDVRKEAGNELKTQSELQARFPTIVSEFTACIKAGPAAPAASR